MEEQLSLLIRLQEIDAKIRSCTEEKNRLPEHLASLERRRTEARESLEKSKDDLQTAQKNRRDRDKDLETGLQKVEKLKARTSEIKTNKEYQALLKEIEAAEHENKAIEDDILNLMERIDAAAAAVKTAEKQTVEDDAAIQAEKKQYEEKSSGVEKELDTLLKSRRDVSAKIDPPLLSKYQKILNARGGAVVVAANMESCTGCYMSIPPQIYVNVKKNDSIITCPQCGRILYYKG